MAFSLKALPLQLRRSVGLGCYLAWVYCSLFSCGLVPVVIQLCSIERSWVYSGIGEAVAAIFVIILYALLREKGRGGAAQRMIGALGAGCACIGSVLIWASHLDISWYAALTVVGGLCCGAGLALLGILWGSRFSYCDEEHIESTVPLSFVISFVVYFVLLAAKGSLFMVVDAVLPVVSTWIMFRPRCGRSVSTDGEAIGALAHAGLRKQFSHLGSLFNMSRTLSIGKVGPGPDILGQALSLSQPSCGDLGVSFRRSSLQFNIRPWRISALGNPLLRLGLPRRNDSLCTRVAPAALAKKETGVRPNGLGFGRRMGWIALCRRGLP